MPRMSAEEFLDKDIDHKLWTMFDRMQDGDEVMAENRRRIDGMEAKLDAHCEDKQAHPNGATLRDKVVNRQNGIIVTLATVLGILAKALFELIQKGG